MRANPKGRHARTKRRHARVTPTRYRWKKILVATFAIGALTTVSAAAAEYTVKRGDTLSQIAAANGTTWQELHKLNADIDNPDLIFPGQVISLDRAKGKPKADKPKPKADKPKSKVRPATGQVTSRYGTRTHPITGIYKLHTGTDFSLGDGIARAAKAGKVILAGWNGAYGKMVAIDHGDGVITRYAHLAMTKTKVGRTVKAGETIGAIGTTGMSTGPHLHFEVMVNGKFVNPMNWLS